MVKRRRVDTKQPIIPRKKGERRRAELLGSGAALSMGVLIISIFLATGVDRYIIGLPQSAAVVSTDLIDLANADRAANHLTFLSPDRKLMEAAQEKANDMATKSYFAHVSPDGKDPWYWFQKTGYRFDYAGENLAVDFTDSSDVERAWMNSPLHRENILDPHYTQIGIATAVGTFEGHPTVFVVQEFGAPSAGEVADAIQIIAMPKNSTAVASAVSKKVAVNADRVLGTSAVGASLTPTPAQGTFITHLVASPKTAMRYAYYLLGLMIIVALAYTTRFELRHHHIRHAGAAAGLVLLMGVLMVVADAVLFTQPVLAAITG